MLPQVEKLIFSYFGSKLPGNPPEKPGWREKNPKVFNWYLA
jgi:hypothetical protein